MLLGNGTIADYGNYVSNCQLNQWPYRIPVNSLSNVQLYIDIGDTKPNAVQYELISTCGPLAGTIETIAPGNYVVAQDTNSNWYGVFKNFSGATPTCFVIAITLNFGASDIIYFSDEYCVEANCNNLVLLRGCYGNLSNLLSYDSEGVYFGTGSGAYLGDPSLVYKHELLLRDVEVSLAAIKNSFKQGRTRNFRTEKERIYQFNAELVPEWYLDEVDAVFTRGEVYVGDTRYLLNETQFELIEECKKAWKIPATFKESKYQSFSCEADPCAAPITECCEPEFIGVEVTEVPFESGFPEESGGGGGAGGSSIIVVEAIVDGSVNVTGTIDPVTGITNGSTVITCASFAFTRVYIERGGIQIFGFDRGDGSLFYTKNFADNFITLSSVLVTDEPIYIETIP